MFPNCIYRLGRQKRETKQQKNQGKNKQIKIGNNSKLIISFFFGFDIACLTQLLGLFPNLDGNNNLDYYLPVAIFLF